MVFRKTLKPKKSKGFMLVHSRARPSIHYFNGNTLATRMRAWHFLYVILLFDASALHLLLHACSPSLFEHGGVTEHNRCFLL